MRVKDMYQDCLHYEESSLAHYIYHLVSEKKITFDDDISKIDLNLAEHQKVSHIIENNVLGFYKIRIFSLKMNKRAFVFIFAGSREEAIQFYFRSFRKSPLNCHEYPLEFEITKDDRVISFRNMKKEFSRFPAIAGFFRRA